MPKLHELLAVQGSLTGQASKVRGDLAATFEKKRHLFESKKKCFTPLEEGAATTVEEQSDIQSTVRQEIDWVTQKFAKAIDVAYQVDLGNTIAKADIVTEDGTILKKDVPATTLLQLEKRIAEWKELVAVIPTLDPARGFQLDTDHGFGHYRARDVTKPRTRKEKAVICLAKATDKHAEQAQLIDVDKVIGTIMEQEWSGLITPGLKADLFDRVETLLRAVTKARSKANDQAVETENNKLGADLLDFVFAPLHTA